MIKRGSDLADNRDIHFGTAYRRVCEISWMLTIRTVRGAVVRLVVFLRVGAEAPLKKWIINGLNHSIRSRE